MKAGTRLIWAAVMRESAVSVAVARGILRYAREQPSWQVHFGLVAPLPSRPGSRRPDGLIANVINSAMMACVRHLKRPAVDLSDVFFTTPMPRVLPDDERIGREAARHLVGLGLQHFATVGYASWHYSSRRLKGFAAALASSGRACQVFGELHPNVRIPGGPAKEECPRLVAWLRALPLPAGLFATTDQSAAYCVAVCREMGLQVPADVAVLGVNNDELTCEGILPTLSSVDPSWERIGYVAAGLLGRLLKGTPGPTSPILVPPQGLVTRQSTQVLNVSDELVRHAVVCIRQSAFRPLGVADVARELAVSRRQLERRFRAVRRRTVLQEIQATRVERARELLATTDLPVKRIAQTCGFSNPTHCLMVFGRLTGQSPSAYRRNCRAGG